MRIAVAGGGELALSILQPLLESRHKVVASIHNGRERRGIGRRVAPILHRLMHGDTNVLALANQNRLPIVWIDKMNEKELRPLRKTKPDIILVGGFGIIFNEDFLTIPSMGCINLHSSLLPKHRGPNPFSSVILANEPESGITFHVMEKGIDTGDILDQTSFPISNTDTSMNVYRKCCALARECVIDVINKVESEGLEGRPQEHGEASYYKRLTEREATINWNDTSENIDCQVRACNPFLMARFEINGKTCRVTKTTFDSTSVTEPSGTVLAVQPFPVVATGKGTITLLGGDHMSGSSDFGLCKGARLENPT